MDTPIQTTMKPLSEVVSSLKKKGHKLDFAVSDSNLLYSLDDKEKKIHPEDVKVLEIFRFEGMSNPSDSSILYVLETRNGESGTLINSYGAESSTEIDDFIKKIN